MKVLVADDEAPKLQSITDWMVGRFPMLTILHSRSVRSTISAVLEGHPDLILLDMSLPTFDVVPGESGGRPQGFGGIEVLRNLEYYEVSTKVVVITQYDVFTDKGKHVSLDALRLRWHAEHEQNFLDCIFYNAVSDQWKLHLEKLLIGILGKS